MLLIISDVTERKNAERRLALLSQKVLLAQEEERARVARDLHDELGQSLAVIQMSASFLEDRLKGAAPTMGKAAKDIMEAAGLNPAATGAPSAAAMFTPLFSVTVLNRG